MATSREERARASRLKYLMKNRVPCCDCGGPMPYPSPGRKYCDVCQPKQRAARLRECRARRLSSLAAYKLARGCEKCGYSKCAPALHFHHLDPTKKEHRVWVPDGPEREKCIIVCANCHFEIHEGD